MWKQDKIITISRITFFHILATNYSESGIICAAILAMHPLDYRVFLCNSNFFICQEYDIYYSMALANFFIMALVIIIH